MANPAAKEVVQIKEDNFSYKTGKRLARWLTLPAQNSIGKHRKIVKLYKAERHTNHVIANMIAHKHLAKNTSAATKSDLIDNQYTGAKAENRDIQEELISRVSRFSADVKNTTEEACVSLRRSNQFARRQPSAQDRVDTRVNLKGEKAVKSLELTSSFSVMVNCRMCPGATREVNTEWLNGLRKAYDGARF